MSIATVGGTGAANESHVVPKHRGSNTGGDGEPFSLDRVSDGASPNGTQPQSGTASTTSEAESSDTLAVETPNGFKVSATHLGGGSAFSAQLLSSMEDMVGYLSGLHLSGGGAPNATGATASSQTSPASNGKGAIRCVDTFHVDLGNGDSVDLHYGTEPGGGNTDAAASEAMARVAEELMGKSKGHPETSNGYPGTLAADNALAPKTKAKAHPTA